MKEFVIPALKKQPVALWDANPQTIIHMFQSLKRFYKLIVRCFVQKDCVCILNYVQYVKAGSENLPVQILDHKRISASFYFKLPQMICQVERDALLSGITKSAFLISLPQSR